jgi:ubiquinone/menaquinone biosynthesis C-methylase UbiE
MPVHDIDSDQEAMPGRKAEAWNSIANGWHEWIPEMRKWYAPATELMLDLAQMKAGDHILDIAAGDCDQSIEAARRVGPRGHVLAIDLAERMLEIGARAARDAGLTNIETRVMDGGNLDLPANTFDATICRFALMFLPAPVNVLQGMNRVLKNGGRVSVVIYADEGDPEFVTAVSVARKHLNIPDPEPLKDSLGSPSAIRRTLIEGGFRDVETHVLSVGVKFASAKECVRYLKSTSPTLDSLVTHLSPKERESVWEKIEDALTSHESSEGFEVDHEVIVAAGSAGRLEN